MRFPTNQHHFHHVFFFLAGQQVLSYDFLLELKFGACMLKLSFLCFGSQIVIFIMKCILEHYCKRLLIYDHGDLSNLENLINFLKRIILLRRIQIKMKYQKNHRIPVFHLEFQMRSHLMVVIDNYLLGPISTASSFNNGFTNTYGQCSPGQYKILDNKLFQKHLSR